MKVISILNLKGGVGKTVSSINIAYTLSTLHNKRVLLIDNDKQGNTSKFFGLHDEKRAGVQDILTYDEIEDEELKISEVIQKTKYENIDVITANMNLLVAEKMVLIDTSSSQQTRLKDFLQPIANDYDYCIVDNAPDLGMSVINALVFSDDVLIPIKIDKFSFDGLNQLLKEINKVKRKFNPSINFKGCFVTMFQSNNINKNGGVWLDSNYPMFNTKIRKTVKVDESTFHGEPLLEYAEDSTATVDYVNLVDEYLKLGSVENG